MMNTHTLLYQLMERYTHTHAHTHSKWCLDQQLAFLQSVLNIVASFDRRGERIVTGSSKGKVHSTISH